MATTAGKLANGFAMIRTIPTLRLDVPALVDAATKAGLSKLVSRIFPENTASLALMAHMGFRRVGIYRRHAKLDGQWRDCVIVERLLGEAARDG
jgi:L-amino acid N-acyltransferase YncA